MEGCYRCNVNGYKGPEKEHVCCVGRIDKEGQIRKGRLPGEEEWDGK